jgi:hypothetical protein
MQGSFFMNHNKNKPFWFPFKKERKCYKLARFDVQRGSLFLEDNPVMWGMNKHE